MIISNEDNTKISIDSISNPLKSEYCWVLDIQYRDFTLIQLNVIEEYVGPIFSMYIGTAKIKVPTYWNILVYSVDTSQLDIVEFSEVSRGNYLAFCFDNKKNKHFGQPIRATTDYKSEDTIYCPAINKTQMLCHNITDDAWVCISPIDNYNKYLKDATIGDILF